MLLPLHLNGLNLDSGTAVAVVTGTLDGSSETDIVAGGRTIIITLTNETWVTAGATFNAQRQNIIDGLDSAQSESQGWNAEVRDKEVVGAVVRTSDTVVTITLSASASYAITANEAITVTVPATAVTGAGALTATPNLSVLDVGGAKGAGTKKKRRRYLVEIDGEFFDADSIGDVQAVLAQARETAEEAAEATVTTPVTPKPPRIKVVTGSGNQTTSQVIQREVKRTQRTVNQAYRIAAQRIARDMEISALIHKKLEQENQDEDDAITALLLS